MSPIEGGQRINLDENNPAVKAVRDGKKVAIDGKKSKAPRGSGGKNWAGIAGIGLILFPLVVGGLWFFLGGEDVPIEEDPIEKIVI